jgi:glycerol-3-phosphate cytidylyltransferase
MVLCSGAFDGLHAGHVRYLAAAGKLAQPGERVTVAVAPDAYITEEKRRNPRWTQADRYRVLFALEGVTPVPQQGTSVAEVILREKPRLFVKGVDWAGKLPEDVIAACREVSAQIVFVNTDATHTREAFADRDR